MSEAPRSYPVARNGADHPLDSLHADHVVVLGVLDLMEQEACRLVADASLREPFWRLVLAFHDEFRDRYHHHREETMLFAEIEAMGLSASHGPTAVLRAEHERGRRWRRRIVDALAARDLVRLQAAAGSYVEFERQHIRKEDLILFPLARRLLGPEQIERLQARFREFDEDGVPVFAGL